MAQGSFAHTLFSFSGRINRAKFWLGQVVGIVVSYSLMGLALVYSPDLLTAVNTLPRISPMTYLLGIVGLVLAVWISLAVMVKRCHDRGKSGWWVLLALIPLVGFIWMIIDLGALEGDPGDNAWGPNPLGSQSVPQIATAR
jgi:uncharacterized membrane protein YhaH (DUF805 family)